MAKFLTFRGSRAVLACAALMQNFFAPLTHAAEPSDSNTVTPIKHVIVIVGENRTFDHLFATYQPVGGDTVNNLYSQGIVKLDGTPGSSFSKAYQYASTDNNTYEISPSPKTLFSNLPAQLNGGPSNVCTNNGMCNYGDARSSEDGLSQSPLDYYQYLLTGGTGLTGAVPDSRVTGISSSAPYTTLQPGPFPLTDSTTFPFDSYAMSPVHRFFQMWQQTDCAVAHATTTNPSGCLSDLFAWTEVSVGSNNNGQLRAANFSTDYAPGKVTTGEGAGALGFYNMAQGDAPYTKYLADHYAMSDNYHQPVMGGTGANSIMLFFGDALWFSDENGTPETPPNGSMTAFGGPVYEIENPNPQIGTNNFWIQDGYGGFGNAMTTSTGTSTVSATGVYGGGSYVNCYDSSQPGVAPILNYLSHLTPAIKSNCEQNHYYLVNNYNPGYFGDGSDAYTDTNAHNTPFTIPGTTQASIGDVLLANNISWKSYNDQWDRYLTDPYQLNYGTVGPQSDQYCNICNGFQYQKQIMTNDAIRTAHIMDVDQLYQDINNDKLPAVSFVKPSGWVDGHPSSSKWDLYEGFVTKIVNAVQSKPDLWASTAIFITTDEGGGYYDSGYIQPLDFFGDGTRIPLIVVSPYTKPGHISHSYADHVSILKFIEKNWSLPTISSRSRDNLPNPTTLTASGRYVPTNSPAISDLFDLFQFN